MEIKDILKQRRIERELTQLDVAKAVGVSEATVSRWESGDIANMKRSRIAALAKILDLSPNIIMGWTDSAYSQHDISSVSKTITFPIIGSIAAGYNGEAMETYDGEEEWIPAEFLNGHDPKDFFVLRVKGSSMYPKFLDGDRVLVQRVTSVDSGSIAVVLYDTKEATLKRVRYVYGEDWMELIPENPEYQTKRVEGVDLEQCRVLGKVVKLIRDI